MTEVSITQLTIEIMVAPVGKSDPAFGLHSEITFGGKGGANIIKFLDCIKSAVIGSNLINKSCKEKNNGRVYMVNEYTKI